MTPADFVVTHVPHSGLDMPQEEMKFFLRSDRSMRFLAFEIADIYTDRIFNIGTDMLVCPTSRLIVDVERFLDDSQEIMAERGLGAIYSNYYDGTLLRRKLNDEDRKELIQKYYIPHHEKLEAVVREKVEQYGECLIIDGHSFSDKPFKLDLDQNPDRPDICIGTDDVHTPSGLRDRVIDGFTAKGYDVKENSPYSGTIVPLSMYGDKRVSSIMIEINKKLYMNGRTEKSGMIQKLRQDIREILLH